MKNYSFACFTFYKRFYSQLKQRVTSRLCAKHYPSTDKLQLCHDKHEWLWKCWNVQFRWLSNLLEWICCQFTLCQYVFCMLHIFNLNGSQHNPNLHWNKKASRPAPYPVHVRSCYYTTTGQGEGFPLIPNNATAAPMCLLRAAPLISVALF